MNRSAMKARATKATDAQAKCRSATTRCTVDSLVGEGGEGTQNATPISPKPERLVSQRSQAS